MKKYFDGKRFLALLVLMTLALSSAAMATPSTGDLLRFIPIVITVNTDSVKVDGYFLNLNENCDIKNLCDVEMSIYQDADLLVSADFGDINKFTLKPMGLKYQSFTFSGAHNLNEGVYDCSEHVFATFSCNFTVVE